MNEFKEHSAHVVKKENLIDEIGNMYGRVKKQLEKEFDKYRKSAPEAWDKAFSENPFYREFMSDEWTKGKKRIAMENILFWFCRSNIKKRESWMTDELSSIDIMGMS